MTWTEAGMLIKKEDWLAELRKCQHKDKFADMAFLQPLDEILWLILSMSTRWNSILSTEKNIKLQYLFIYLFISLISRFSTTFFPLLFVITFFIYIF
jgi:hypothetical protein